MHEAESGDAFRNIQFEIVIEVVARIAFDRPKSEEQTRTMPANGDAIKRPSKRPENAF